MIKILDYGYLKLVEAWGSDQAIVEAARMSTQKGFLGWGTRPDCETCRGTGKVYDQDEAIDCPAGCKSGDEKLLKTLYDNKHATPFEFGGLVIEVQAPIFVFREWHRHRTQSYNEMSARYEPLPDFNYIPTVERLMLNAREASRNKQAGTVAGAAVLTEEMARQEQNDLHEEYAFLEQRYQQALARGVPKELARIRLPVGRYSRMRAHANLRNWLAFLTLRMDKNAQWEIRQYANAVGSIVAEKFPRTWELFSPRRKKE